MEIILIALAAFFTAILTFFSGFGLGTILTPVFVVFFPVDVAIALTGVVHFANNIFKIILTGKNADRNVLMKFGIPAVLASFAGAWLLIKIAGLPVLIQYQVGSHQFNVTPIKLIIAILLIVFSILEMAPYFQRVQFGKHNIILGGALSGFFGGLTGIQGAIRSAFLIKSGLSKDAYIATGVVISCFVDFTRLSVYVSRFATSNLTENIILVISAVTAAMAGAFLGNKLLNKITFRFIRVLLAIMLMLIAFALGGGLI